VHAYTLLLILLSIFFIKKKFRLSRGRYVSDFRRFNADYDYRCLDKICNKIHKLLILNNILVGTSFAL